MILGFPAVNNGHISQLGGEWICCFGYAVDGSVCTRVLFRGPHMPPSSSGSQGTASPSQGTAPSHQTVLLCGSSLDVPQEVFGWLVDFGRDVRDAVSRLSSGDLSPDEEEAILVSLVASLVEMEPGVEMDPPSSCSGDGSGGEDHAISLWLWHYRFLYARLLYDLVDLPVLFGGVQLSLRDALSDIVREDIDLANWGSVRSSLLRMTCGGKPLYTDEDACRHADEWGHLMRRSYGRDLLSCFLERDRPEGGWFE